MRFSRVDESRYVVRADGVRCIVSIYWKETERDQREDNFRRIRDDLVNVAGARK